MSNAAVSVVTRQKDVLHLLHQIRAKAQAQNKLGKEKWTGMSNDKENYIPGEGTASLALDPRTYVKNVIIINLYNPLSMIFVLHHGIQISNKLPGSVTQRFWGLCHRKESSSLYFIFLMTRGIPLQVLVYKPWRS
jgi:hypothetical protein